jgi:hypothetical protein
MSEISFVMGILSTLVVEITAFLIWAIYLALKGRRRK